jgi:hypothetical protein
MFNFLESPSHNDNDITRFYPTAFHLRPSYLISTLPPLSPPRPLHPLSPLPPFLSILSFERERERENENEKIKEIESNNEYFTNEKNIKYNLYPLYINWKKIESKSLNNSYYNVFKLFGYFGEAIFNIIKEANNENKDHYTHRNFLSELNLYNEKYYSTAEIKENRFFKRLVSIYDDVISLIKNNLIIYKEITVYLIVMRLYEKYFLTIDDATNVLEVLKMEFKILSNMKDNDYKKIYNVYYKKVNRDNSNSLWSYDRRNKLPKSKESFINYIKIVYKKLNIKNKEQQNES